MPTTQPLDEDIVGDILGGPLKSIAGFAQPGKPITGQAPKAAVPNSRVASTKDTQTTTPTPATQKQRPAMPGRLHGEIRLTNVRTPSIGMNGKPYDTSRPQQPQAAAPTPQAQSKRTTPYTVSDIRDAWQRFIDTNGAEHLLVNAMRVAFPTHESEDSYLIAQSKIHIGYIRDNLVRLTKFVREAVMNDNVMFTLKEVSEDSPLAWNDRELIQHIIENNPEVGSFLTGLDLHIL